MKELLIKLLEFTVKRKHAVHYIGYGLCNYITYMNMGSIFTSEEAEMLRNYLRSNKPENHGFYKPYYWKTGDMEDRINYLQHHINKL